jgi:general stress protein 26
MTDVNTFAEIEQQFNDITRRVVWATVTTVDARNRPRSRILHPVWQGSTGWIATGRHSHKARHLASNPFISCTYWDQQHQQVMAECEAHWADDLATRTRIWRLLETTPEPVGYNPALFWKDGPESPDFGVLQLQPWRIEVWSLTDMAQGKPPLVWRGQDHSGA